MRARVRVRVGRVSRSLSLFFPRLIIHPQYSSVLSPSLVSPSLPSLSHREVHRKEIEMLREEKRKLERERDKALESKQRADMELDRLRTVRLGQVHAGKDRGQEENKEEKEAQVDVGVGVNLKGETETENEEYEEKENGDLKKGGGGGKKSSEIPEDVLQQLRVELRATLAEESARTLREEREAQLAKLDIERRSLREDADRKAQEEISREAQKLRAERDQLRAREQVVESLEAEQTALREGITRLQTDRIQLEEDKAKLEEAKRALEQQQQQYLSNKSSSVPTPPASAPAHPEPTQHAVGFLEDQQQFNSRLVGVLKTTVDSLQKEVSEYRTKLASVRITHNVHPHTYNVQTHHTYTHV